MPFSTYYSYPASSILAFQSITVGSPIPDISSHYDRSLSPQGPSHVCLKWENHESNRHILLKIKSSTILLQYKPQQKCNDHNCQFNLTLNKIRILSKLWNNHNNKFFILLKIISPILVLYLVSGELCISDFSLSSFLKWFILFQQVFPLKR